jgi:hypothetical protein
LQRLHQQRGDWSAVIRLLPELRKDKVCRRRTGRTGARAWGKTCRWRRIVTRTASRLQSLTAPGSN